MTDTTYSFNPFNSLDKIAQDNLGWLILLIFVILIFRYIYQHWS
jgi:hypothetical protein